MVETKNIEERVWDQLHTVMDPEIPHVSITELGMVVDVQATDDKIFVELCPTFTACPATNVIRMETLNALLELGVEDTDVKVSMETPWSSNRITDEGRRKLKKFGLAPPEKFEGDICMKMLQHVPCPHCDSKDTTFKSQFGSTLCRAIHYCNSCKQAFEQFKPL